MTKVIGDNIVSKVIDYLKNFDIYSNLLIPLFLCLEFLRKTYILNVPLLSIQTIAIEIIKSKGSTYYNYLLEIFSKLKIKNYDGTSITDSFPSNFINVKSIEEIWKIVKLNLPKSLGNDLLDYINNNKKDFSKKALKDDIYDIKLGIEIDNKVKETLSNQDINNNNQEGGFFYIKPEDFQRKNISSDITSTDSDSDITSTDSDSYFSSTDNDSDIISTDSDQVLNTSDISEFLTDVSPVFTSDISPVRSSEISKVRSSEISSVSSVLTEDIQNEGVFGIFMKPLVRSDEISEVTPINTSDISTVSSVFTDEIQNGLLDIFVVNNVRSSEISDVPPVRTSSLSNIYSSVSPLLYTPTSSVSSVTNTDTEYLMKLHPEIFAKYEITDLKSNESIDNKSETNDLFDSNIWLSSSSSELKGGSRKKYKNI